MEASIPILWEILLPEKTIEPENPMNRVASRTLSLAFWILAVVVAFKTVSIRLLDPDLWWHLANGRAMVEGATILRTDIFSHTLPNVDWVNFEWLAQIVIYLLYKGTGFAGLYWLKIFLCSLVWILLIYSIFQTKIRGPLLFLLGWIGFLVIKPRLFDRIELVTLMMLPLFIILLSKARSMTDQQLTRLPWLLGLLMVVWCNLHGGFVYGVGLVVLFMLGSRWANESPSYIHSVDRSLVIVLLALFLNPYGPKLVFVFVEHIYQLIHGLDIITEWSSPPVAPIYSYWILLLVSGGLLAYGILHRWPHAKFWGPALILFLLWSRLAYRNTALLAFVALPFIGESFVKLIQSNAWRKKEVLNQILVWIVCLLLFHGQSHVLKKEFPKDWVYWRRLPVKAVQFVQEQNIHGTLFNSYRYGGYLAWMLGPKEKIFMDGRYLFYPLVSKHRELTNNIQTGFDQRGWTTHINQTQVDYAITNYPDTTLRYPKGGPPFGLSLVNIVFPRAEWALAYWDDESMVFLKRIPKFRKTIQTHEYTSLWPYNFEQNQYLTIKNLISKEVIKEELARHKKVVGFSRRADLIKRVTLPEPRSQKP